MISVINQVITITCFEWSCDMFDLLVPEILSELSTEVLRLLHAIVIPTELMAEEIDMKEYQEQLSQ
jgi:hypothetical protein